MSATADQRERLRTAAWLRTAAISRVFEVVGRAGGEARAVGGAVRNTLLGVPIDDVDIATTARPESVLAAASAAGVTAIPTGLKHGTVTLVVDKTHYEVTTLRRDLETDGRHATVAFTDDWADDARRRDFTINALYCDANGTLFDPLGAADDLYPARVRFIGDARERLREDYLRILRFFRFSARFAVGPFDADGLRACDEERDGLLRVSRERVRVELLKLLVCPRAVEAVRIMQAHGFLSSILGVAPYPGRLARFADIEAAMGLNADPVMRLAALALAPCMDVGPLASRLRLSGEERYRLAASAKDWPSLASCRDLQADHAAIYRRGLTGFRDAALLAWAGGSATVDDRHWRDRIEAGINWPVPRFPVSGDDVMANGISSGPGVGRLLAAVEKWWIDRDLAPDRAACLEYLASLPKT